jgi:hypothetical protein
VDSSVVDRTGTTDTGSPLPDGRPLVDTGAGADSPVPTTRIVCQANATPIGNVGANPSVAATVVGANGTFVDHCDAQGNLVNYSCETALLCGPAPNPSCTSYETGNVITNAIDCAGHCAGGTCDGRCPMQGDRLAYVSVDPSGGAVLTNVTQGRRYVCTVFFTGPGFNCATMPMPGAPAVVYSLGLHGLYCTGAQFGNIGVSLNLNAPTENCGYACSIAP